MSSVFVRSPIYQSLVKNNFSNFVILFCYFVILQLRKLIRTLGVAATRANARMRLRVLGTSVGRRGDSQYNRTAREEARFREAEWDNYNRHGPRGHAQYHHGFEHCI